MKRLMMTTLAAVCACAAAAQTVDDAEFEDAIAAFDAAVAHTNITKIAELVAEDKVALEYAVHKTMGVKPYSMCNAAFRAKPSITNYNLTVEAIRAIDFVSPMSNVDIDSARNIVTWNTFPIHAGNGREVMREIYAANPLLAASIYCIAFNKVWADAFAAEAAEAYSTVKPIVKEQASPTEAAVIWHYARTIAKDYSGFASMYDKKLLRIWHYRLYPTAPIPEYIPCIIDQIEMYKNATKPNRDIDRRMIQLAKTLDRVNRNKNMMLSIIDSLSCSKSKLTAALYCNDVDKIVDILIDCDTSFDAADINSFLIPLNGLDPNYRTSDVVTALKAVNQRYTLKLYDDRDTWEPVISKIRALIDARSN